MSNFSETTVGSTFDVNGSVVHLLHRAGQCTGETFNTRLAQLDVTPRQFAVLVAVGGRDGATQTSITEDTGIDRSTMVDVVRRLLKRGLLQRRRSRLDARSYLVRLTAEGRALLAAATPHAIETDALILSSLSAAEREVFLRALSTVVATQNSARSARASALQVTPKETGAPVSHHWDFAGVQP